MDSALSMVVQNDAIHFSSLCRFCLSRHPHVILREQSDRRIHILYFTASYSSFITAIAGTCGSSSAKNVRKTAKF